LEGKCKISRDKTKQKIADELVGLAAVQNDIAKYSEYIRLLNEINYELTDNIDKFKNNYLSEETVASELILLCENLKENISKFSQAQSYLEVKLSKAIPIDSSSKDLMVKRSPSAERLIKSDPYKNRRNR
jgi:hypothetical protein